MSFINSSLSALARLGALAVFAGAFLFGLAGVVYLSLQGDEVKVPEITGKNLSEGEQELASLGLKIKKRADRFSPESPNTVIEQLPKPGETVKPGQMIMVVTSRGPGEGDLPPTLKQTNEDEDKEKIEEMISDKPKKVKPNTRKKADTARDVSGNTAEGTATTSDKGGLNSNKKETGGDGDTTEKKPDKGTQPPGGRVPNPPADTKPKPRP